MVNDVMSGGGEGGREGGRGGKEGAGGGRDGGEIIGKSFRFDRLILMAENH